MGDREEVMQTALCVASQGDRMSYGDADVVKWWCCHHGWLLWDSLSFPVMQRRVCREGSVHCTHAQSLFTNKEKGGHRELGTGCLHGRGRRGRAGTQHPQAPALLPECVLTVLHFPLAFLWQLNRSDSDSSTLSKKPPFVRNSLERRSVRMKRVSAICVSTPPSFPEGLHPAHACPHKWPFLLGTGLEGIALTRVVAFANGSLGTTR